jgi:Ca2+-binding EF-hand superfamily protein
MKNLSISSEDVKQVAESIGMKVTDSEVQEVLELYTSEQKKDKSATWNLVVENILYNLK